MTKEIKITNTKSGKSGFVYGSVNSENGFIAVLTINGWVKWDFNNCLVG